MHSGGHKQGMYCVKSYKFKYFIDVSIKLLLLKEVVLSNVFLMLKIKA